MYKIIKNFLVATLILANTMFLGGSTNQTVNNIPTIKEIEEIMGYREQLLITDTTNKTIKITKDKAARKPKTKDKEVFVEVAEDNKPVREELKETKEVVENVQTEDNNKVVTEKVDEILEETEQTEEVKQEVAKVYSNEVEYSEVIGEVYANEAPYEEVKDIETGNNTVEGEIFVEVKDTEEEPKEPIIEEEVVIEEEPIIEEPIIEESVIEEEPREDYIPPTTQGKGLREYALSFYGGSYVWGGTSPSGGFDCSGLSQYIYSNYFNIWLPRTVAEQAHTGYEVAKNNLLEGDLIIFQNSYSNYPDHIGIYIGQGEYLHASSPSRGITTDSIYGSYFANSCISVRRHIGEPTIVVEEPIIEDSVVIEETVIEEEPIIEEPVIVEEVVEDNSYTLTMSATAYTHTGNPTASGVYPTAYHTVSVDPDVIPLGTRMYIEGYGYAVAEDTGSAIKGNILDIFFDTYEECVDWGYRTVTVTILD